jgi:uncharacterized protein involved in exopolysaccharide biosynthesis
MLQSLKRIAAEDADSHSKMVSAPELFHAAVNFARRQFSIIALTTLGVVALVGVYLLTAPPSYTAELR